MSEVSMHDGSPLTGARRVVEWLEFLVLFAGVLTTIVAALHEKPWILTFGVAVIVASVAWYLIHRAMLRRRRPLIAVERLARGGGAYLRGLLHSSARETPRSRARREHTAHQAAQQRVQVCVRQR